jgi:hypothetical protein
LTVTGIGESGDISIACSANTGAERNYKFKFVQNESGKEIELDISQDEVEYIFSIDNAVDYAYVFSNRLGITKILPVVSVNNSTGSYVDYTKNDPLIEGWYTVDMSNMQEHITVTVNELTSSTSRYHSLSFIQNFSGKTVLLSLSQYALPDVGICSVVCNNKLYISQTSILNLSTTSTYLYVFNDDLDKFQRIYNSGHSLCKLVASENKIYLANGSAQTGQTIPFMY